MRRSFIVNTAIGAAFVFPLFFGACNTEDVNIDGTGIGTDSTEIFVDSLGRANAFIVSTLYPWTAEYIYEGDQEWLHTTPSQGERTATVTLTAEKNEGRRRTTFLRLDNGHRSVSVKVTQKAGPGYEPATAIIAENFGLTDVSARTSVANYTYWGRTGTGASGVSYSGVGATVQADVSATIDAHPSRDDVLEGFAYLDATGGNNVEIAPGGSFTMSRINISAADRMILTLHVASSDGSGFLPDPLSSLSIRGGTLEEIPENIPFEAVPMPEDRGWHKVSAEFRKIAGAGSFYLTFANTGADPIYIDDIMLEPAGKGQAVIGTPVPNVTTLAAENVSATTATIRGSYTLPAEIAAVDSAGFYYKLDSADEYIHVKAASTSPGQAFSFTIPSPSENEIYFYRAYAAYDGYLSYGDDMTVTIEDPEPEEGGDGDEE